MGPDHLAVDVRGVAAGCQGRCLGPVRNRQLANGVHDHARLHAPRGQIWPVGALPVLHGGVCDLHALQRLVHPGNSRPLPGRNRELLQDRAHFYHQRKSSHSHQISQIKKNSVLSILDTPLCIMHNVLTPRVKILNALCTEHYLLFVLCRVHLYKALMRLDWNINT